MQNIIVASKPRAAGGGGHVVLRHVSACVLAGSQQESQAQADDTDTYKHHSAHKTVCGFGLDNCAHNVNMVVL